MKEHSIDAIARAVAERAREKRSRRAVLRSAVCAAATGVAVGVAHETSALARMQEVPLGTRAPGGRTTSEAAFDLALDPMEIFRYVNEQVLYDPYAGALRGATGTLWAMAGNSVDQALLLADLLREALVDVRFVAGELDDQAAGALLAAATLDRDGFEAHVTRLHATVRADAPDITPEVQTLLDSARAEGERRAALAVERWETGVAQLQAVLADAGVKLPGVVPALPKRERTQHVWVQYREGTEWIDLDPTMPGAEPGSAYAEAREPWDELPDELFHTVTVRVRAERIAAGQLTEGTLLEQTLRSADLTGVPLTLTHYRPGALAQFGVSVAGVLEEQLQYIPNLAVGDERAVAGSEPLTILPPDGATDILGEKSNEGDTAAEWVDFEVRSPDHPAVTATRVVFDRLPPEARSAGALSADQVAAVSTVELGPEFGTGYLPLEQILSVVVTGGELPSSFFEQDFSLTDPFADLNLPGNAHEFARGLFDSRIAAGMGHRVYLNRPKVTGFWVAIESVDEGGPNGRGSSEIDLIQRHYAAAPIAGGVTGTEHPLLAAGVVDHTIERLMFEPTQEQAAAGVVAKPGVGALFEAAAEAGQPLVVLSASDAASLQAVPIEARARVGALIEAGALVIAPDGAVDVGGEPQYGFWAVDAATGAAFDEMANGRGAEGVEYEVTQVIPGNAIAAYMRYGICLRLKTLATTALLMSLVGWAVIGGAFAGGARGTNLWAAYGIGSAITLPSSGAAIGAGLGMGFAGGC
jgi:hypothetical protein